MAAEVMKEDSERGLVLALGGGGARGLAHISVLGVLEREGIPVRAIVGTSVGAEIGAFYAAGMPVREIRRLACSMDWISTLRLFTPDFPGPGISTGKGIHEFLAPHLGGRKIEDLKIGFAAIATDLSNGEEVVIDHGDLLDAVRASISYPGLLSPFYKDGRPLVDGGIVNPVPFDVARRRFGRPVLAVSAHPPVKQVNEEQQKSASEWEARLEELLHKSWLRSSPQLVSWLQGFRRLRKGAGHALHNLGVSSVLNQSQLISAETLVQLRMQLSPPDVMLRPDVGDIGLLEFYRAREAITAGRRAANERLYDIKRLCRSAAAPS